MVIFTAKNCIQNHPPLFAQKTLCRASSGEKKIARGSPIRGNVAVVDEHSKMTSNGEVLIFWLMVNQKTWMKKLI